MPAPTAQLSPEKLRTADLSGPSMIRSKEMNGMLARDQGLLPGLGRVVQREEHHAGRVTVGDDVLDEVVLRFAVGGCLVLGLVLAGLR